MDETQVKDGGFNKLTWGLLTTFGAVLLLISVSALSTLFSMKDRLADQASDIRVILTNQEHYARDQESLATDVKAIDQRLRTIEARQVGSIPMDRR